VSMIKVRQMRGRMRLTVRFLNDGSYVLVALSPERVRFHPASPGPEGWIRPLWRS